MPRSYPPNAAQRDSYLNRSRQGNQDVRHQPFAGQEETETSWSKIRAHLVAMQSEFIGTIMFLWFSFAGTQAAVMTNPSGNPQKLVYISLSFGFSLMITVWAHYRISGGLFNPAVTLALCLTGNMPWVRGLMLLPAQLVGGIVAAGLASCMLPGPIDFITTLSEGTSIAQGVFVEAFGTALLVFTILMLAAEKHETTPFAPVGIGIALFVGMLGCVLFTSAGLNPVRAFGPSVIAGSFPGYHWLYWIGPLIGTLMASGYYGLNRYLNYEEANPGQDSKRP